MLIGSDEIFQGPALNIVFFFFFFCFLYTLIFKFFFFFVLFLMNLTFQVFLLKKYVLVFLC